MEIEVELIRQRMNWREYARVLGDADYVVSTATTFVKEILDELSDPEDYSLFKTKLRGLQDKERKLYIKRFLRSFEGLVYHVTRVGLEMLELQRAVKTVEKVEEIPPNLLMEIIGEDVVKKEREIFLKELKTLLDLLKG